MVKAKKIVVLDGFTLNPGDLNWTNLRALAGECQIFDRTPPELVLERAAGADVVLTNKVMLNEAVFAKLPDLKYVGVLATGYNVVDIAGACKHHITVTNIPTYGTNSVAQHVFALLLELANHTGDYDASIRKGDWSKQKDCCYHLAPLTELAGKTFGLIGYGRIGSATAAIARAFQMNVVAYSRSAAPGSVDKDGTLYVTLEELLRQSDVVSLHCPLTADNQKLINLERLKLMKKTAFLINTARGALIDAAALNQALKDGLIAGAGIDVLEVEPPPADHPLLSAPNVILTPHTAWATFEARRRLLNIAVDNVQQFLNHTPVNVVS